MVNNRVHNNTLAAEDTRPRLVMGASGKAIKPLFNSKCWSEPISKDLDYLNYVIGIIFLTAICVGIVPYHLSGGRNLENESALPRKRSVFVVFDRRC